MYSDSLMRLLGASTLFLLRGLSVVNLTFQYRSGLLAEDVQGRVDITRTFDGRELNTAYLFGLFAISPTQLATLMLSLC